MTKREWKPGEVAVIRATYGPAGNGEVEYAASRWQHGWALLSDPEELWSDGHEDYICEPVRPLVVIDPEDREQVERLFEAVNDEYAADPADAVPGYDVRVYQRALREFASPTPPKPDEPTGLGAVVMDSRGEKWLRLVPAKGYGPHAWIKSRHAAEGVWVTYDEITAVKVLSEGVK